MFTKIRCPLLVLAIGFILSHGVTPLTAQEPPYKGKTIRMIAGFPPGGGVDAEARLLARYLERHIPGRPTVVVQNMPGAGGLVATNWFEQFAKPDGLFLHYTSTSSMTQQVLGVEEVRFDLRGWEVIGGVRRGGSVAVIRQERLERLTAPGKPLAIGTRGGDESWNAIFLWGAELLKWNVRWIMGYPGSGDLRLALQREETDIFATAVLPTLRELMTAGFHPFVQQGSLTPSGSFQRRPEFSKVSTFEEILGPRRPTGAPWQAYISWAGVDSAGRPLYAPPRTPPEVVRVLREAFSQTRDDTEFKSDLKRVAGEDAELLLANEAEPILRQLLSVTPEVRDFANGLMKKYLKR
ncbi:MAG: Bug family tripartite tricarboxylate transporter substrate binding protein [Candidatus Binatia bacterium]